MNLNTRQLVSLLCFAVAASPIHMPALATEPRLPLIGSWPGYPHGGIARSATVVGDYVYLASGPGGIQIINVSNPNNPSRVGHLPYRAGPLDYPVVLTPYAAAGDFLYAGAAYRTGLFVIDARDPANPRVVSVSGDRPVRAISISGNRAFVGAQDDNSLAGKAGIQVFDITTPEAPVPISFTDTLGYAITSLAASGNILFASEYSGGRDGAGGLLIFDVSNPSLPIQVGRLSPQQHDLGRVALVDENHVAILDSLFIQQPWQTKYFLQIVDVSNPAAPARIGSVEVHNLADITVAGPLVYLTAEEAGLQVVDISDLTAPRIVAVYDSPGTAWGVSVSGSRAFLADGEAGLQVLDIGTPANPRLLGSYTFGTAQDVVVAGQLAYVADGHAGLQIIDISQPRTPQLVGSLRVDDYISSVQVESNVVLLGGRKGLHVVDIGNPMSPQTLSFAETAAPVRSIALWGSLAYVANSEGGLAIVDLSDPRNPERVGRLEAMEGIENVAVSGDYAYIIESAGTLFTVLDVNDPNQPRRVGSYLSGGLRDIALKQNYAYLATEDISPGSYANNGSLIVLDLSDPKHPERIAQAEVGGDALHVTVEGTHAYVSYTAADLARRGVRVFDISDPNHPVHQGHFMDDPVPGWGWSIGSVAAAGRQAWVASGEAGLHAIDITQALISPRIVSHGQERHIYWDLGILQFAPSPSGPWADLPAASPFKLSPIGDKGFFRVKVNE